jgi:hypothetical protein
MIKSTELTRHTIDRRSAHRTPNPASPNAGMALLTVMILLIGVAGIASVLATRGLAEKNQADHHVFRVRATAAAEAGLEQAVRDVWQGYLDTDPAGDGSSGSLVQYFAYLDRLAANNEDLNHNGIQDGDEVDADGDGSFESAAAGDLLANARQLGSGARIDQILVDRLDDSTGTSLVVSSLGSFGGVQVTASQQYRVGGERFKGFGFALLANNINCIMCHADFDNVDRVNNTDPNEYGNFDRIKIASLESLLVRVGSADSTIAGTYYTRGVITDKEGAPLATLAGSSVDGYDFDLDGHLLEDASGDMTQVSMDLAGTDAEGYYDPLGHLYTDYPTVEAEMTDGELPNSFPPVIPDTNGNKYVDQSEFDAVMASLSQGEVTGGTAFGLPHGTPYGGTGLPSGSNGAAADLSASGSYDGNLILVGTDANPIRIEGKIAVNGDVMISGPIEGTGQIFAKRNMYFAGDTTYADASGSFGESAGGTDNLVAYAAGGNILVGDYLTPKSMEMEVWDEKKEHWKVKNADSDVFAPEYLTEAAIDPGGPPNSGTKSSFTMSEVTLFNKMEYTKAQADPSYTPRYYRLRPTDSVYRWTGDKEHGDKYDENFTAFTPQADAAILDLSPSGDWISELMLKQIWQDDENARAASGSPFQIDGLLYTNNSIMALARSNNKHKSRTFGQLYVRGGLIASDVGILSAGDKNTGGRGFVLHYDERVGDFLGIEDIGNLEFTKLIRTFH